MELGSANSVEHNVRFVPDEGASWVAAVRGEGDGMGFAIRTTPDPHRACVLAGGGAYLVDVHERTSRRLDVSAVQHVVEVPEADLLVLADFTDLFGVGRRESDGRLDQIWASGRVATDDVRVVRVDGVMLECRGLDGYDAPFTVDARTGARVGRPAKSSSLFSFLFNRKD